MTSTLLRHVRAKRGDEGVAELLRRAVVRAQARDGYRRHRHLCDWTRGLLSQPPALFGLPPARVEESSCEPRGDDHCLYAVTWDADRAASAADPQELVTALESQLVA